LQLINNVVRLKAQLKKLTPKKPYV